MKSRKFTTLRENNMLPDCVREQVEEIEKNKGKAGFNPRQKMTELIEGVMVRRDGRLVLDEQTPYCKRLAQKTQQRYISEKFDVLI